MTENGPKLLFTYVSPYFIAETKKQTLTSCIEMKDQIETITVLETKATLICLQ